MAALKLLLKLPFKRAQLFWQGMVRVGRLWERGHEVGDDNNNIISNYMIYM